MNNSSLLADVSGIPYFCFKKMRKYLLSLALVVGVVSMNAQEKVTNNVNMENKKSTLRLAIIFHCGIFLFTTESHRILYK